MKVVYPAILFKGDKFILAKVPDLGLMTQGEDLAEAIKMTRDIICLTGIELQDEGGEMPKPSSIKDIIAKPDEIVTLVDADLSAYRTEIDNRSVRKNCTLPSWLNAKAEKAGINFSQVLKEALEEKLYMLK